jgi:predicted DNA-binding transcriptional regulator YafY
MHRILWFDQEVRAHRYPNCSVLAKRFEISVRQANRDMEYLKNSLGAPLKYIAEKRGYIYEDETFTLPNIYITREQKKVLSYLAYSYENYSRNSIANKTAALLKKLADGEQQVGRIPVFDADKPMVNGINKLLDAVKRRKKAGILYKDAEKGIMQVIIHPYKLFNRCGVDYIAAFCEDLKCETVFRLDRIMECEITQEGFKLDPGFYDQKYSSFVKKKPFLARIEFYKDDDFNEMSGFKMEHIEGTFYDIQFYNIEEFLNQLLSTIGWKAIHSPRWLKEKLIQRCHSVIERLK